MEGLQEAHKSIIHRDLKPENILIGIDGNLQICDFGIAKYVGMLTRTKSFKGSGTYAYMPPECWNAETNTVQMDIYSLGFIFYEILTRQQAFKGTSEREFKDQHLYTPFPAISGRTDIPILIQEVIKKMTRKNAGDRYPNVTEILNVLYGTSYSDGKTSNAVDSILKSAQKKAKEIADLELARQKIKDQQSEFDRNLNFSIDELFNQFAEVGDKVNATLQEHKLDYSKFVMANPYANHFRLNFFDGVLDISFFNQDIKRYIENEKKRQRDAQQRQYGMVLQPPVADFIEKDGVILVGKAILNNMSGNDYYGYNLILRKEHSDDLYGKWWICKFSDNAASRNARVGFYYALVSPEFFVEYNIGRACAMHMRNMAFHFLTNEIAAELIAAMPQTTMR